METAGQFHSLTGLLIYEQGHKGIIFNISFPYNLFGFYYSRMEKMPNIHRFEETISYFPMDSEMERFKSEISESIAKFLPHLTEFDNDFAEYKINKIMIACAIFYDIDLYKAIFSTNDHGIV